MGVFYFLVNHFGKTHLGASGWGAESRVLNLSSKVVN
jgi:hypothetical protein